MTKKDPKTYKSVTKEYWCLPENIEKIKEWAEEGFIIEELARRMGIARNTLYGWRKECPEIEEAWLEGKYKADMKIVAAMFKGAHGFTTKEITREPNEVGDLVITKEVEKFVPGNTTSQAMWIKNRMPEFMKDNQLTDTYKAKVEAETARIKAQTELIEIQKKMLSGEENGVSPQMLAFMKLLEEKE